MDDQTTQRVLLPAQFQKFALATALLVLCFSLPLWRLARFAAGDALSSYILLIPPVCVYLAWLQKKNLPEISPPAKTPAAFFLAGGIAVTAWHRLVPPSSVLNGLACMTLAFVLFLAGAGFLILGGATMRVLSFPFAMLVFMIPFPDFLRDGIEAALQHGSAVVAGWMFAVSDVPVFRESALAFRLPSITLQVAPECSGIHSTVVLFITSLVAGHFFLREPWKRAVLCLAVIPLALLRNGFRIFVIGELCTHIGPQMIDSPIHRHGGPLFFALSLLPFFLLLYLLNKSGRAGEPRPPAPQT